MNRNKFIVIEGVDGAGKSTITQMLSVMYNHDCEVFAEPTTNSPFSQSIRDILSGKSLSMPTGISEIEMGENHLLELFKQDRLWNIYNNLLPSIHKNKLTILDRYYFSTAAYQGIDRDGAIQIAGEYLDNPDIIQPDFVFYLKVDADTAMERIMARKGNLDIFEKKTRLEKIIQNYDYIFSNIDFPFAFFILDALSDPFDLVHFIATRLFPPDDKAYQVKMEGDIAT